MITQEKIDEWRKLRKDGRTSALGEYTPEEFWELLDEAESAFRTLRLMGYTHVSGAELWKPPIGPSRAEVLAAWGKVNRHAVDNNL